MRVKLFFFFFKQKTAYEMRISDWSSDVCSSDVLAAGPDALKLFVAGVPAESPAADEDEISTDQLTRRLEEAETVVVRAETLHDQAVQDLREIEDRDRPLAAKQAGAERDQSHASDRIAQLEQKPDFAGLADARSEEHTSELQSLMRTSYAVFCL